MGLPVLIMGYSGSGKTASLRRFGEGEIALVNVNGKALPFRTVFREMLCSDSYPDIDKFMHRTQMKTIIIDDCQYLMANEFMRRVQERGYEKFTEIGQNFWGLVHSVFALPPDVTVYFLSHIDTDENGRQKIKTIGKMLDEKITVEGMFTVVLKTVIQDGHYYFATQSDGRDTCKSPMGLFPSMYIDNDLKSVDNAIREYYNLTPIICADCGGNVRAYKNRPAGEIAEGTRKKYGRILCWDCACKVMKQAKEAMQNAGQSSHQD